MKKVKYLVYILLIFIIICTVYFYINKFNNETIVKYFWNKHIVKNTNIITPKDNYSNSLNHQLLTWYSEPNFLKYLKKIYKDDIIQTCDLTNNCDLLFYGITDDNIKLQEKFLQQNSWSLLLWWDKNHDLIPNIPIFIEWNVSKYIFFTWKIRLKWHFVLWNKVDTYWLCESNSCPKSFDKIRNLFFKVKETNFEEFKNKDIAVWCYEEGTNNIYFSYELLNLRNRSYSYSAIEYPKYIENEINNDLKTEDDIEYEVIISPNWQLFWWEDLICPNYFFINPIKIGQ